MPTTTRAGGAERSEPLAALGEELPVGLAILDEHLRVTQVNRALCQILALPADKLVGRAWPAFYAEGAEKGDGDGCASDSRGCVFQPLLAGERTEARQEGRFLRFGAESFWAQATARALADNGAGRLLVLLEDIDERKRAARSLEASERHYRLLFERNLAGAYRTSLAGEVLDCNEAFAQMFGWGSRQEALQRRADELYFAPEDRQALLARLDSDGALNNFEARLRRQDGQPVWVLANEVLLHEPDRPPLIQGTIIDITERKVAEEALRRERDFVAAVVDTTGLLVLVVDRAGRVVRFSRGGEDVTGFTAAEMLGRPYWSFLLPPERQEQARRFLANLDSGFNPDREELECQTKSGQTRRIAWSLTYMRDGAGAVQYLVATGVDVTEQRRLESQLRQAQKMEAIGQLAGGIAHDFNNLLTVITGHCDLLLHPRPGADPAANTLERAGKIKSAADRAVGLTRQLLAFSRAQVMAPRSIDLNQIIAQAQEMLRPLLGEQVELVNALAPDLGRINADPVQIEQVLLNLAINARDAMAGGGRILIETANAELDAFYARSRPMVKPGNYVLLSVTDTGSGMDAATQARIFEPFFTTKEPGRGTGLGLATVYGIVKQSEGYVWVYSEVGRGTTFKIYLPRVQGRAEATTVQPAPAVAARGHETILLVEDDEEVRLLARELLESHGYRVLEAADGASAVSLARRAGEPIDLLLTDVVMPGMTGKDLAEQIRGLHADLRVVYTSGYTDQAIVHNRMLEPGLRFVQKPFTAGALAARVRATLDGSG